MSSRTANAIAKKAKKARARAKRSQIIFCLAIVAVGLLIAAFLAQTWFLSATTSTELPKAAKPQQIGSSRVSFSGIDANSKPFVLNADEASQDEKVPTLIHLKNAHGRIIRAQGANLNLNAQTAHYDLVSKDLKAEGNVIIEQPGKYKVTMQSARMNLEAHSLLSDDPVIIETPNAYFAANQFEMGQDGQKFILRGRVKATIETNIGDLRSEKWRQVK